MKITREFLKNHRACQEQRELFEKAFPGGMEFTFANLMKAARRGLEVHWLKRCLTAEGKTMKIKLCLEWYRTEGCPANRSFSDGYDCRMCTAPDIWNLYVDGYWDPSIIKELGGE